MFDRNTPATIFAALAAGAAIKYAVGMWSNRKKYKYVGKVSGLWIHPFKSFKAIRVNEAEVTRYGMKGNGMTDRHWVCTTPDGTWLSQRQAPTMALIEPVFLGDEIELRAPGMQPIRILSDPKPTKSNMSKATVKLDTVQTIDLGDAVATWLSTFLQREGLRLHYSAPSLEKRDSHNAKKNWVHPAKKGDMCGLQDYCAYMIISDASLAVLNSKLEKKVPIQTFRCNIEVDDCQPFAEDNWSYVRIGGCELRALDACTRCIMVTVDPLKGVKDPNEEPLKTLKTFRKREPYGEKPCFGVNHTFEIGGNIKVGDPIYAVEINAN